MLRVLICVTWLASALAVPRGYSDAPPVQNSYVLPPRQSYVPPPQNSYVPPPQNSYVPPPQNSYVPPVQNTYVPPIQNTYVPPVQNTYVPPPQNNYVPPAQETFTPVVEVVETQPTTPLVQPYTPPRPQPVPQPVLQPAAVSSPTLPPVIIGAADRLPARYTQLDYNPTSVVNRNPGTGGSGPMGVFVGACAASLVCVPEAMCNPYTGFVRGGLLNEPTGPSSQPTVALLRCYRLKDGGVGDGVCCQMPHINDPWPDFQ